MKQLIVFLVGFVIGFIALWFWKGRGGQPVLNQEQERRKRENLEKILELVKSRGQISNDHVEKTLGVSNATAERYLQELESEGKIEQIGDTGRGVYYRAK